MCHQFAPPQSYVMARLCDQYLLLEEASRRWEGSGEPKGIPTGVETS